MGQLQAVLERPEIQTGVAPFVVALVLGLVLKPAGGAGVGLAVGFYTTAYLINVLNFTPLTSTSKLLLIGGAAVIIGIFLDLYRGSRQQSFPIIFILATIAAGWLLWPLISRNELSEIWPSVLPGMLYLGWLAAWSDGLRDRSIRATSAVWVLSFAVGAMAVIGAAASLGQLGIALGAAAGALCILSIILPNLRTGSIFALSGLILAGCLSLAGVFYARIPWYSLLFLAAIPPLALIPLPQTLSRFTEAVLSAALLLPFGIAAVFITWQQASGDSLY